MTVSWTTSNRSHVVTATTDEDGEYFVPFLLAGQEVDIEVVDSSLPHGVIALDLNSTGPVRTVRKTVREGETIDVDFGYSLAREWCCDFSTCKKY